MKIGDKVKLPSGYYANGDSRPMRDGVIIDDLKTYWRVKLIDGEKEIISKRYFPPI